MKETQRIIVLLLALLLFAFPALGEGRYPACKGAVTDLAGVLDEGTAADFDTLSKRLEKETGGRLFAVTRHFLGGDEAAGYAKGLFSAWELAKKDALLLMVIGEEDFALVLGSDAEAAIPKEQRTALLGTFRAQYLARNYSGALGQLALSLSEMLAKSEGKSLRVNGLFGQVSQPGGHHGPRPSSSAMDEIWDDMFDSDPDDWQVPVRKIASLPWKKMLIWGLIIYFLFFRKKKREKRRSRRRHY